MGDVAGTLLPLAYKSAVHAIVIVGTIGAIALVNLGGAASGARLVAAVTVVKLIPLAVAIGAVEMCFAERGSRVPTSGAPVELEVHEVRTAAREQRIADPRAATARMGSRVTSCRGK